MAVLWTKAYHRIKDVYKHFADRDEWNDVGYHEDMRVRAPTGIYNASYLKCQKDVYDREYPGLVNIHEDLRGNRSSKCVDCHRNLVHSPYVIPESEVFCFFQPINSSVCS